MKQKNPSVSKGRRRTTASSEGSGTSPVPSSGSEQQQRQRQQQQRQPLIVDSSAAAQSKQAATATTSFRAVGSSRASTTAKTKTARTRARNSSCAFLANLSRLLVPFFVLISTTRCSTTTSLSPLGLYKVGIGATNLVENILGHSGIKTKAGSTTTPAARGIVNESKKSSNNVKTKRNRNGNKNKSSVVTNKKRRRDKNKNSTKRSNSDSKKKTAKEKDLLSIPTTANHHTQNHNRGNNSNNDDDDDDFDTDDIMSMIPGIAEEDRKFVDGILSSYKRVRNWDEDEELLKKCRSQIPWEELMGGENSKYADAENDRLLRASGLYDGNGDVVVGGADSNALFLQRVCRWFQSEMTWMNNPPCSVCGCKDTEMKTVRGPETAEEHEGEARRVEVYYCPVCDANTTTFPRYNKAAKLIETRQGRCGEYANLFGQFCRAAGFETRLVLDWSDHLWTEVRLGDDSWVMADACEGVIDKPSMYEHGWGKDGLSYMVGIGSDHVVDVTPRYTRKFMSDDFQSRRRAHTQSEEISERILRILNEHMNTHPAVLPKSRVEELARRRFLEDVELRQYKQATEWTEQEKYGSGRISGSLAWRRSRQEAGSNGSSTPATNTTNNNNNDGPVSEVAGFPVEAFIPARLKREKVSFKLRAHPSSRHDAIVVSDTPCAVGVEKSVSVVVVDNNDKALGCILQSKSFVDWEGVTEFLEDLPSGRIVLMNGKIEIGNETQPEDFYKEIVIDRLGGWNGKRVAEKGVLFAGQTDAHPDWAFCRTLEGDKNNKNKNRKKNEFSDGYEVEIEAKGLFGDGCKGMPEGCRLRTERSFFPQRIAGRLPEEYMPLNQQQNGASETEKRNAYLNFAKSHGGRYCGYTTKKNSPVYLLDSTAYPLQHIGSTANDVLGKDDTWNTFLELPEALVRSSDCGIDDTPAGATSSPIYDVPLDSSFFNSSLGPNLLSSPHVTANTADALSNARLIGLYFSAHWCGPCRSFTPMLAEMYEHLTETHPTHGLEIVFVSSDRDEHSFGQYYNTMPWKAIPFNSLQFVKQALNMTYGVRGISAFVVLDAVSGEVVVSADESRREVVTACRGGDLRIEAMFQSWLGRTPSSTKELLSMIEFSALEIDKNSNDSGDTHPDQNPYLKRTVETFKQVDVNLDFSMRFKAEFEKLVTAGHDPNAAAAKALATVTVTPANSVAPGNLNGKALYAGKARPRPQEAIDEALEEVLERNSASTVSAMLSVALKYLKNSEKVPWEPKYRRFKLSNKVADKINRVEGGLGLLQSLGFEVIATSRDFEASIPVAANLTSMDTRITRLLDDMNKAATSSKQQ